ncbi:MAG: hypothetical protein HKN47_24325 [Pirellulaceae bacterium]|nr:hypothetical protein [Pirellulaceae bacterium]
MELVPWALSAPLLHAFSTPRVDVQADPDCHPTDHRRDCDLGALSLAYGTRNRAWCLTDILFLVGERVLFRLDRTIADGGRTRRSDRFIGDLGRSGCITRSVMATLTTLFAEMLRLIGIGEARHIARNLS